MACSDNRNLPLRLCAILLAGATLAGADDSKNPACDRDCLRGFITEYLNAMIAHHPSHLSVTSDVRFTEDTVETKLGASPLWRNASRLRPYRLDILDVREGVAASLAIVEEAGAQVMLALRLRITGRKIAQAETQVTRNKAEGSLFNPDALQTPSGAMLLFPDPSRPTARKEMIKIAEFYPAGLKAGSFVTEDAPFAATAYRLENGQLMAGPGCTFRPCCENTKTQKIHALPAITYRVAAVDEDMGIVLLHMDFGAGSSRVAWEAFKVYGGQIQAVEAFVKNMPLGSGN